MSGFNLGDYKEVADRIPEFYANHPDGRIAAIGEPKVVTVGNKTFIGVTVGVWRTPTDPQPCIASAWEPFPGATSYTKDSEMMNAETSAWGRALVAAGILAKGEKIASREEVRNRRAVPAEKSAPRAISNQEAGAASPTPSTPAPPAASPLNMDILYALGEQVGFNRLQVDAAARRHGYEEAKRRLDEKVAALP